MDIPPWEALERLADLASIVQLSKTDCGDEVTYSATIYLRRGRSQTFVRRTLAEVILAAAGLEAQKRCGACGLVKSLEFFGANITLPDGRARGGRLECRPWVETSSGAARLAAGRATRNWKRR